MKKIFTSALCCCTLIISCSKGKLTEAINIEKDEKTAITPATAIPNYVPITSRYFVQQDTIETADIVDGQWVAIGNKNSYAIQKDNVIKFNGKPSYRFELKQGAGEKDRAELQYVYATNKDFQGISSVEYQKERAIYRVYERGKGISPQATKWSYKFSAYVPSTITTDADAIFAQIHGMNSRTLVSDPNGVETLMTNDQFLALCQNMVFTDGIGYNKATPTTPNGWMQDTGSYPPMQMGFAGGYFYITASSDRKWVTFVTDRNGANPATVGILAPRVNGFKTATIAYKEPIADYPKNTWVTFQMDIDFSAYGGRGNQMLSNGKMDVVMNYTQNGNPIEKHIVNNADIAIGRNDEYGYYFKFGIYRPEGISPVVFNMAGFSQTPR